MKAILNAALISVVLVTGAGRLLAQALDRVEKGVRRQVEAQQQGALVPVAAAEPGYLGVIADDRQEQGAGVRLLEVVPNTPAAKDGLQRGDLITAVNGQAVRSMEQMAGVLQKIPAGGKAEFFVDRGGQPQTLTVTLGQRPVADQRRLEKFGRQGEETPPPGGAAGQPSAEAAPSGPRIGVRTVPITEETRQQFKLPSARGALVTSITVGSAADAARIPLGAAITAMNGQPVGSPADLSTLMRTVQPGQEIELTYFSGGQEFRKRLAPGAAPAAQPAQAAVAAPAVDRAGPVDEEARVAKPQGEPSRIEALEQRIRALEERIKWLESQQPAAR